MSREGHRRVFGGRLRQRHGHGRVLHRFPSRRSSDLGTGECAIADGKGEAIGTIVVRDRRVGHTRRAGAAASSQRGGAGPRALIPASPGTPTTRSGSLGMSPALACHVRGTGVSSAVVFASATATGACFTVFLLDALPIWALGSVPSLAVKVKLSGPL